MNGNSDRDLWKVLFNSNRQYNEVRFKRLEERLESVEEAIVTHSKRSLSNSQNLYLLMCGIFLCFFVLVLLSTSIEGSIGTAKISYSSNGVFQFALSALSLGGGGIAIAQLPSVKNFLKK
jgi:hypothetical protein